MKRNYGFLAAGILMLVASSCCSKGPKVTAMVAGEASTPVAVVVEYPKAVKADAVNPGSFVLPGNEVAFAFVTDECPGAAQECCEGDKPECKPGEKPECCKEGKPECCKGEKPECNGEKPECCKEGKPECCKGEKPECKDRIFWQRG